MPSSLVWILVTLLAYWLGNQLFVRLGRQPLANPVFSATALLMAILWLSNTAYVDYFQAAQPIHFLLGPATVALAVPLYLNLHRVRQMLGPLLLALVVGCVTGIASAVWLGEALGLSRPVLLTFAPKSVTTPIAMALAEKLGGIPSLAAAVVLFTGVLGAMFCDSLFRLMRIRDDAVKGIAIGVAAHGAGTARAFQISETCGAFSGLAMGVNGMLTSVLLPVLLAIYPV